jgi:hypothetical protein
MPINSQGTTAPMAKKLKVVFFAPHSAIWVHAFPEALIAEALKQDGHEIVYVTCGELFSRFCVCMSAHRIPIDAPETQRRAVCEVCNDYKAIIRNQFGFAGYDLASILSKEDLAEADRIAGSVTPENLLNLRIDGIEVGRAALSTFLLTYKRASLTFSEDEWRIFRIELVNTLRSFLGCRKVLGRERPDRVILYSSGYSVNLVWCLLAEARGIPFYYMNAGSNLSDRLQKVVLFRGHSLQRRLLSYWERFQTIPCLPSTMAYVADHFLELLRGRHGFVYSAPKGHGNADLRRRFGIRPEQKILLATLSSYDELFAAQVTGLFPSDLRLLFPRQVDWVQATLDFVRARPDLFLIVRVHPREFPNKRDSVKSEHAFQIEEALRELPSNAAVNWPSDGISLYDLADITDVCLNSWSSAGKEMSLLGIPVVIYSGDLVFYPPDLNYLGETLESYYAQIEQALKDGWSVERIRRTFRWLALEDLYSRLDISDSYHYKEHARRSILQRVVGRIRRQLNPHFQQQSDSKHRAVRMGAGPLIARVVTEARDSMLDLLNIDQLVRVSEEVETRELKIQIGRLASALYSDASMKPMPGTLRQCLLEFADS